MVAGIIRRKIKYELLLHRKRQTMPKIILTIDQVKQVKQLLLEGELAHHEIAARVGISRPQVSKIHLGMKDPYDKNGRWQKVIV